MTDQFTEQKKNALAKLEDAKRLGRVDSDVITLLAKINTLSEFYTTSSCSGRIALFCDVGSKLDSYWIGKWHRKVSFEEVCEAFKLRPDNGIVWFFYEPSIFHIVSRDILSGAKLMTAARNLGFKKVGMLSAKPERNIVEICSSERIAAPISADGASLVSEGYLSYLASLGNTKLDSCLTRLRRFEDGIIQELLK